MFLSITKKLLAFLLL